MTIRHAGNLNVADTAEIATQLARQVTLDNLTVIAIELNLEVRRAHLPANSVSLILAVQKKPRHVPGIDRLQQHSDPNLCRLGSGIGKVLQIHTMMPCALDFGRKQTGHHVDLRIAQHGGIFKGAVKPVAELRLAPRQRSDAPLSRRPIPWRRVEQGLYQAVVRQPLLEFLGAVFVREQIFNSVETIGRCGRKTVQEAVLRIKHAEVGSKTRHISTLLGQRADQQIDTKAQRTEQRGFYPDGMTSKYPSKAILEIGQLTGPGGDKRLNVDFECVVVGAGVVGLAVAREMARAGREVLLIEAGAAIGTGISSRNSEVIHAGIYYPPGSLKAQLCVEGRRRLYDYCERHGVETRRLGKLIVATSAAQVAGLQALLERGLTNGVDDLRLLDQAEALDKEPALACVAALYSPSTGIVDSHALMLALQGDAEAAGAQVAFHTPLLEAQATADGFTLTLGGTAQMRLSCRQLINAAGLQAPALARRIDGLAPQSVPDAYLCKGNYFSLAERAPFRHLVYPAPETAGLGIHMTLDLAGQARFGPDIEWVTREDYQVDPARAAAFYPAIRNYWPGLPDQSLQPAYSGIRPKIGGPDEPSRDFRIDSQAEHGVPGLINLFGIESPGLTACLAIAVRVRELIEST